MRDLIMRMTQPTSDWNYRLVRYFLENTQLTALLLAVIILAGGFSLTRLRTEGFPEVPVPVAIINTVAPGAGPETVAASVTTPIEDALRDVPDLKEIRSVSQSNVSLVVLSFEEGSRADRSIQEARTKLASVALPEGVREPEIVVPEIGGAPYIIAVTGNRSIRELLPFGKPLEDELKRVKGIKSVTRLSNIQEQIYIEPKREFQSPDLAREIRAANTGFPLGEILVNSTRMPVAGKLSLASEEDVKNIRITVPGRGTVPSRTLRLAEAARVYTALDYGGQVHRVGFESGSKLRMRGAVLYTARLTRSASLLATDTEVKKALENLNGREEGVRYEVVFNQAEQSRRQIDELVEAAIGGQWNIEGPLSRLGYLFGGIWLLMIGILLFLDWRSALISVVTVPLSFLFTFIYLDLAGIELNVIVLFSLVLVLGLIVDPAIVVLESIRRYLELGYRGNEAVLRSVQMIGRGVFIAVLTSLIVFLPFGIVSGIFGEIIQYIPFTVIPALLASYFVPMFFLTWFAGRFLRAGTAEVHHEYETKNLWRLGRRFIRANRFILARRWLQIAVVLLGVVIPIGISLALFQAGAIHQVQFSQPEDIEFLEMSIPTGPNPTNAHLLATSREVEAILASHKGEIKHFFYRSLDEGAGASSAMPLFVALKDKADRDRTSGEIAESLDRAVKEKFGERARASELTNGPPQASFPVSVPVFRSDPDRLLEAAKRIAEELRGYPEVAEVRYDGEDKTNELVVVPKESALANAGIQPAAILGQVGSALGESTLLRVNGHEVILRSEPGGKPQSARALKELTVVTPRGNRLLHELAAVREEQVPEAIRHLNGERFAEVRARVHDERDAIEVQRRIDEWVKDNVGILGLSERDVEKRGAGNEFEQSFQELFAAIWFSLVITYVAFVVFFRSLLQPFIILFAVPLMFIGVFPALALFTNGQLGFLEVLGIIMVIGIVENVGIFLIDLANRMVAEGVDKKEAIALASGIRLRPIILTKITALAGLLPLAVFSSFWRGLAVVIIAGILASGILSLFTTPVLYSWLTRTRPREAVSAAGGGDSAKN